MIDANVAAGHAAAVQPRLHAASASGEPSAHEHAASRSGEPSAHEHAASRSGEPSAHEHAEGIVLSRANEAERSAAAGPSCPAAAPVRAYDVVAIPVEITLNRFLDYDPDGRMYALTADVARIEAEVERNRQSRAAAADPAVSLGLQGDAIQPLALRVRPGECLRIRLHNALPEGEAASLHIHGAQTSVRSVTRPAWGGADLVLPGGDVELEWFVDESEPEGTHYFHSDGNPRVQTGHGLFGAVIVEPPDSAWLDPLTGQPLTAGWAAVIDVAGGADFREYALFYHEIGDEKTRIFDHAGEFVPEVDPYTTAYRPGTRALNYRSEPFLHRLQLQEERRGYWDESVAYSSATFGDPATPILRAYLGDPVKQRLIHGGAEGFHVHHVHGGAIRWPRQPRAETPQRFADGLDKHPPLLPAASERLDSQGIVPSETFDIEDECGAGGCQQGAGDFLFHCHVAHHYFAGMWGLWRVYNTLQAGAAATDSLPALHELPDREGGMAAAIASDELPGRSLVGPGGASVVLEPADVPAFVEAQLPPPGAPVGYDAAVMDWRVEGGRYVNTADVGESWANHQTAGAGVRPPILFDPRSGRLAYPFLQPRLGTRPPFAPGHGPAPFLDPFGNGSSPPAPGANGASSVCPAGTQVEPFTLHAITVPVTYNAKRSIVDPNGQIFVLKSQEDAARSDNGFRRPLAIRANAGVDCVDIVLKNELPDGPENHEFSKVTTHVHFAQFDVQASDGVSAGFNYEQSIRPFAEEGQALTAPAAAGDRSVTLDDASRFHPLSLVGVGMDEDATFEIRRVAAIEGSRLLFESGLEHPHPIGAIVSTEFVRYRWFPDVQFGTAYFHDHVNAISSWRHGLYGALIAEPPDATFHDPHTGAPIESGPIADVRTAAKVSADLTGSFRELVLFLHDEAPITHVERSTGSAINLRVEPLDDRTGGDPSRRFSSADHGDPETPILEAFVADPVVVRALVGATNESHSLHVDGHWARNEPHSTDASKVNTVHLGISERADLVLPAAGGPQNRAGDYLYMNGRTLKLREGSWGLLRVLDWGTSPSLEALPGRARSAAAAGNVCPSDAPVRAFDVSAVTVPLAMLDGDNGRVFVLDAERDTLLSGDREPEPLVLHVNSGDCLTIGLTNRTPAPVVFHAPGLAYDPRSDTGLAVGTNPGAAVPAGGVGVSTFYADPELGQAAILVRDAGDVLEGPGLGLYGAIVVGPRGAAYRNPVDGTDASGGSSWRVDVLPPGGTPYRDFTLLYQDQDETLGTHRMPYTTRVAGPAPINYRAEPLDDDRRAGVPGSLFSAVEHGDPATPLMEAYAGDPLRINVLSAWSEQPQAFSIEGHQWPIEPAMAGSNLVSTVQLVGMESVVLFPEGGAGGRSHQAGDFVYGNHREPYREAGMWGLLRVHPPEPVPGLQPLAAPCGTPGAPACAAQAGVIGPVLLGLTAVGAAAGWFVRRRRRIKQVA